MDSVGTHAAQLDVSVDGLRLHWSRSGRGPRTVLLVHGWICDETTWREQVPVLSKEYQVVTLDLPGHGRSESPADGKFSIDLFSRAVDAVRRETNAEKVALVGHSLGTLVILQYAGLHPSHVAALVFVEGVAARPRTPALLPEALTGPNGAQARERMIRASLFSPTTPIPIQTHVLSMMVGASDSTVLGVAKAVLDPAAWSDDVLDVPVLAIYRERSKVSDRHALRRRFPALEYVELRDAGHFLMMERVEDVNRLLLTFLSRQTF
jgi:3-oxoadipate enol-lactonase